MFKVYTLSDSSGETAELVAKSALSQFESYKTEIHRLPQVRSAEQVKELFSNEIKSPAIIVYTLVLPEVRQALIEQAQKHSIPIYDVLGDLVSKLEGILHAPPLREPGLRLKVDQSYFNRMDAIHYAIKFDDGQSLNGIESADVVLIGVSRTGKTPSCMYLAQHYGLKAANIPIVSGVELPKKLFQVPSSKIIGLMCDPLILQSFRSTRASSLQMDYSSEYCDFDHITKEVEHSKKIFRDLKCEVVDMTNRAVEETAVEIVAKLQLVKK
ncbi:MAG: kinase/pyrophosphorylase [Candidatus Melainabacteria bacterium]|nr:kinase/pyrophosphorylase [Candidatus Melainabacteria bacterium]